jgi:hypothetical protein
MKRSTWVLLLVLAIVVGAYYLINKLTDTSASETLALPSATPESFLLADPEAVITSIRIFDRQYNIVELQRNDSGSWTVTLPWQGAADSASVGAAETQLMTLRVLATFQTAPDLEAAGLTDPEYTFRIGYASGAEHIFQIGNLTPTGSGYYVRLDRRIVSIVSVSGIEALTDLFLHPPYLPTLAPTAEPTGTPVMPESTPISTP